jgi:hypothetical protein
MRPKALGPVANREDLLKGKGQYSSLLELTSKNQLLFKLNNIICLFCKTCSLKVVVDCTEHFLLVSVLCCRVFKDFATLLDPVTELIKLRSALH